MPTNIGNLSPYCTAAQMVAYCDWRLIADWASEATNGPPPTRAAVLDPTDSAGANVQAALKSASGDLESYCLRGGIYSADDLSGLTGNTANYLQQITAGLALWKLASRRAPGSAELTKIPTINLALEALESLRKGERIFGLQAQVDAGSGMKAISIEPPIGEWNNRTVNAASRYFGRRNRG